MRRYISLYFPDWSSNVKARKAISDPVSDFRALYRTALWALKLTPFVGLDYELLHAFRSGTLSQLPHLHNGILLDISGTEKLYKQESLLLQRLSALFLRNRIKARIACAPSIGAAWALARFNPHEMLQVDRQRLKPALSPLPVQALRINAELINALHKCGIYTIKELLNLPRKTLPVRFGGLLLQRLDQALGMRHESLISIEEPRAFKREQKFDIPVDNHSFLVTAVLNLLRALFNDLKKDGKQAARFTIYLYYLSSSRERQVVTKEFFLNTASSNFTQIASVLHTYLETVKAPRGIEQISISARDIERKSSIQEQIIEKDLHITAEKIDQLLNNFSIALGHDKTKQIALHESHIPERSYSFQPLPKNYKKLKKDPLLGDNLKEDRPSYMLQTPQEILAIAMLPDKPPSWIKWNHTEYKIVKGYGPERIAPEWWDYKSIAKEEDRDYFKVQEEKGTWFWIFRYNDSQKWFVHGIWA